MDEPKKDFAISAVGLAQEWCFLLARRKFGASADYELDMVPQFEQLLDFWAIPGAKVREAIREKRDRAEYFWQFKERLLCKLGLRKGKGDKGRTTLNTYEPCAPLSAEEAAKRDALWEKHRKTRQI